MNQNFGLILINKNYDWYNTGLVLIDGHIQEIVYTPFL